MFFTSIDHVHVPSIDMDKSVDFYTRILGFYLSRRLTMNGRDTAFVGLGDMLLEVHPARDGVVAPGASRQFGLSVSNMDEALAHLKQHGIEPIEQRDAWTFWGRHAAIADPSGIVIELREWTDGDGPHNAAWQPRRDDIVRTA